MEPSQDVAGGTGTKTASASRRTLARIGRGLGSRWAVLDLSLSLVTCRGRDGRMERTGHIKVKQPPSPRPPSCSFITPSLTLSLSHDLVFPLLSPRASPACLVVRIWLLWARGAVGDGDNRSGQTNLTRQHIRVRVDGTSRTPEGLDKATRWDLSSTPGRERTGCLCSRRRSAAKKAFQGVWGPGRRTREPVTEHDETGPEPFEWIAAYLEIEQGLAPALSA